MGVLGINDVAFRSHEPPRPRSFYLELLGAEALTGAHDPVRAGGVLLVFFASSDGGVGADPDELTFDVDAHGFEDVLARARRMGLAVRGPVDHTPRSRGLLRGQPGRPPRGGHPRGPRRVLI